ncbi:hypothetical protein EYF80_027089 [Liparis tanakae]|uniref:Uncharacterized protein n=1 Tax=Liparis tanakae TaxID=230148 RepID=A0A4Z2H9U1_9TELE|nr:hypothetical protein EYF80_027089 [Liparis tanakae]
MGPELPLFARPTSGSQILIHVQAEEDLFSMGNDPGVGGASALGLMFLKCCRYTTSLRSRVHGSSTEMSFRNLELMPK